MSDTDHRSRAAEAQQDAGGNKNQAEDLSEAQANPPAAASRVLHFLVRGRVQGVGFRWFVHREAAELGLRGWVRNLHTGEVELIAAGNEEDLAELRLSLRRGSRGSRVDQVLEHQLEEQEGASLEEFKIEGAW